MTQILRSTVDAESQSATGVALLLCMDAEVHDLADAWLRMAGIRVISASSAQDALRRILDERVELLVLDTLPIYVQGLPSLLALKQGRKYFHVILIPGLAETPQVGVARIAGVDAVLVRPLSKSKLLSVIDALG